MKLFKLVVVGLVLASCSGKDADDKEMVPLAGRIMYSVKVDDTSYPPFQYLEVEKRHELATLIFKQVESGKLKLFLDEDGTEEITPEMFRTSNMRRYGYNVVNENGDIIGFKEDSMMVSPRDISEYSFIEAWKYHPEKMTFIKEVKAIGLMYPDFAIDSLGAKHLRDHKIHIGWFFPSK
jgi:hypothetical protein